MMRRDFIAGLGVSAALPLSAHAQARGMRKIGYLAGTPDTDGGRALVRCFLKELAELGWSEGANLSVDIRWGGVGQAQYEADAADLRRRGFDLMVATSTPAAQAARKLVTDKPVVFIAVSDPVKSGLAASLARPGGNMTGVSNFLPATTGKLIETLKIVATGAVRCGVLHNPANAGKLFELEELRLAGRQASVAIEPIELRSPSDHAVAFDNILRQRCDSLVVLQEGVTLAAIREITEFAKARRIPSIYQIREFVEVGGLMSYGLNYCDHYARAAVYVDKILRGADPRDLPVELPTRFELVVNAKTAKELGLELPATFLARADEVIE